ncbi:hypothetical protein Mpal_2273 [Methanosphaerula palustris E1-9c]|uniref:Uncharacterized protein n=1 Tax=Methanosphaerula palustris (strain ATCC BAA-1556 / DSM 19958 / E1-9c) TaxID=521011 RepID=B8GE61_METPE|nr:hypothetical protein Mpal_2273 [Methanosphaerula palustris E1-9c]
MALMATVPDLANIPDAPPVLRSVPSLPPEIIEGVIALRLLMTLF